mgnify:CR=1 FL=1
MSILLLLLSCSPDKAPTADLTPTDTGDGATLPSGETDEPGETGLPGDTETPGYTLSAHGLPATVPGVVLMATLIGEEASVSGFVEADVSVDLDADESRYAFRYQVLDDTGALGVATGTVKNHISNILSKMGVRDRTRAVLKAIELGHI